MSPSLGGEPHGRRHGDALARAAQVQRQQRVIGGDRPHVVEPLGGQVLRTEVVAGDVRPAMGEVLPSLPVPQSAQHVSC